MMMMGRVASSLVLAVVLCFNLFQLCTAEDTIQFWVDGDNGIDDPTCGPTTSPCKSLSHIVNVIYENNTFSYVEINLKSNLLHETCDIPRAFLSTVIIHINGNENTIKNSTISIPKVEFMHTWFDSSSLSGHEVSFVHCTITQCTVFGLVEQEQEEQPALTLDGCHLVDSNADFHALNISNTLFSNSPIKTPDDGTCDITGSNFTGSIAATALSCGEVTITASIFNDNQGVYGGAINIVQFAYIGYSSIFDNSAEYGGGIYSQGIISLDNVQITGNKATQGGGIYLYGPQTDLECVDTVLIANNHGEIGGGIVIVSSEFTSNTEGTGQQCTVQGNQASTVGGAIYVNSSSASVAYFLISDNTSPVGAGIFSTTSSLNLSSVTVSGNIGGGIHSTNSSLIILSSKFANNTDSYGAHLDIRLQNSSSFLTSWDDVSVSSSKSFLCDDCNGKLCSAGSSCSDCRHTCITMGPQAVCIESHFECDHGICENMKDQNPTCLCDDNYTGDLCDVHMPLASQWENVIFIIIFGVGCTLVLALVVALVVRLHRHRSAYQPLLSYAKLVARNSKSSQ